MPSASGSPRGLAETLVGGGEILRFAGDLDRAVELKEELASVEGKLQRPNWRAATLADLARSPSTRATSPPRAVTPSAARRPAVGARAALGLAELGLRLGDLDEAESRGREALAGLDAGSFNHACTLEILGETARRAGDPELAYDRFRDGLREFVALGDGGGMADCLEGLARLAAATGDAARAGRLLGSAETLRETRGRRPIRADEPPPAVPEAAREEA